MTTVMARLGRFAAVFVIALFALAPIAARADCDTDPMSPTFGQGCPTATPYHPTPKPTTKPATPAPKTPAPTTRYVPPPVSQSSYTTPEPTAFPIEVTTPPDAATDVVVEPDHLTPDQASLETKDAASASSWIFGFIVGLIIGGLIGRASWGLRRRRRQQIFG